MKQATFRCESCGAQVMPNARFCFKCGNFFVSVKCPKCGHTASAVSFTNGCPKCGYAAGKSSPLSAKPHLKTRKKELYSLPAWIYALTGCILLFLLAVLFVI